MKATRDISDVQEGGEGKSLSGIARFPFPSPNRHRADVGGSFQEDRSPLRPSGTHGGRKQCVPFPDLALCMPLLGSEF